VTALKNVDLAGGLDQMGAGLLPQAMADLYMK